MRATKTEIIEYLRNRGYSRQEAQQITMNALQDSPVEIYNNATRFKFTVDFKPVRGFGWLEFQVTARNKKEAESIASQQIPTLDNTRAYKVAKVIKHLDY